MEMPQDWAAVYKFARLAFLGIVLAAIAIYLYNPKRREELEAPAKRMLEDDDE